jgi:hypothetical protein
MYSSEKKFRGALWPLGHPSDGVSIRASTGSVRVQVIHRSRAALAVVVEMVLPGLTFYLLADRGHKPDTDF